MEDLRGRNESGDFFLALTGSSPTAGRRPRHPQPPGAGNDTIDGGLGFDTCTPGPGNNNVSRCEATT